MLEANLPMRQIAVGPRNAELRQLRTAIEPRFNVSWHLKVRRSSDIVHGSRENGGVRHAAEPKPGAHESVHEIGIPGVIEATAPQVIRPAQNGLPPVAMCVGLAAGEMGRARDA